MSRAMAPESAMSLALTLYSLDAAFAFDRHASDAGRAESAAAALRHWAELETARQELLESDVLVRLDAIADSVHLSRRAKG